MITLSNDGYVRLTFACLQDIQFVHLLSGLDDDYSGSLQLVTEVCEVSGYTEWVSCSIPVISIGWDWGLDVSDGRPCYVRVGSPRSNVMIIDPGQRDLGPIDSTRLLEAIVDSIDWQDETANFISTRYAYTT